MIVDPDILGSIPTMSYLGLPDTGYGGWDVVFLTYSPRLDPKGPALVRFHLKKKKVRKLINIDKLPIVSKV